MIHTIQNPLIYIAAWACNGTLQRKQRRRLHSVLAVVIPGQMIHDVGLNVIFILKRNGSHPALQQWATKEIETHFELSHWSSLLIQCVPLKFMCFFLDISYMRMRTILPYAQCYKHNHSFVDESKARKTSNGFRLCNEVSQLLRT